MAGEIRIRAFKAIDDEASCLAYLEGHRKVLEEHGFTHFKTNTASWFYNPFVYVLVAEDLQTGEYVGGVRLEIADDSYELPTQLALKKIEPRIVDFIKKHQEDGLAECCGLWNAKSVAGKKISLLLVRASTALAARIHLTKLMAFLATYTEYISRRMGYAPVTCLGKDGDFNYPNEHFIARVHLIDDVNNLQNAATEDKSRINELIKNPDLQVLETEIPQGLQTVYNIALR